MQLRVSYQRHHNSVRAVSLFISLSGLQLTSQLRRFTSARALRKVAIRYGEEKGKIYSNCQILQSYLTLT